MTNKRVRIVQLSVANWMRESAASASKVRQCARCYWIALRDPLLQQP